MSGPAPRGPGEGDDPFEALAAGRWVEARNQFEAALADAESAEAHWGLGNALWWLGENRASVEACSRAYTLFRAAGDTPSAAQCALWLAITYKANFANGAAANGWLQRADRLLAELVPSPLHGWAAIARAYRMPDLEQAAVLTASALETARAAGDVDLELAALAQLGLVRVGQGETDDGFALIDEAMAAALAGESATLDTVVYACCGMLTACELARDIERAAEWCQVADGFVDRYGCPFLYAECRISYGSVLVATGRWDDAERELGAGIRITDGASPGLHRRAVARLAELRVRQGRLEDATALLDGLGDGIDADAEVTLLTAAVSLARGDAGAAVRLVEPRLRQLGEHRWHLASALDLLVGAHLTAGDVDAAASAVDRLEAAVDPVSDPHLHALATAARGRVCLARGDGAGVDHLEDAVRRWSELSMPLEAARIRLELAAAMAVDRPELSVDHARRALRVLDDLGASIDADRAAALLRRLGVHSRTGVKGAGNLTNREREVLQLLGSGLSNPEIAARLHVSRKTAAHHVSSILAKLGVRNRAEAAAHARAAPQLATDR